MKINKELLEGFSWLVVTGAANCVLSTNPVTGSGTVLNALAHLADAVTGNLASGHFEQLISFNKLKERLKNADPNKINHDLERLLKESSLIAIDFIRKLFLAEIMDDVSIDIAFENKKEKQAFIKGLEQFFDENTEYLRLKLQEQQIDTTIVNTPKAFLTEITDHLFGMSSVQFDPITERRLKDFYAAKLPYCFELAFKEALKHDDIGFKAFQIWILEAMQQQNLRLLSGQQTILQEIENIKAGNNWLSKQELDKVLDVQAATIYNLLEKDFNNLTQALEALTRQIDEQFDALYNLNTKIYTEVTTIGATTVRIEDTTTRIEEKLDKALEAQPSSYPHLLNNIPRHTDEFIGREDDLQILERELKSASKVVLVNGIGGIGKTTLAKKYVEKHKKEYSHIAWIEVKANDTQEANTTARDAFINAFAYEQTLWHNGLHLSFDNNTPLEDRFTAIIHTLRNIEGKNLLVIDNAGEEIKEFMETLPAPPEWEVLVTSRNTINGFAPFHLDKLEKDKAIELFTLWYKADEADVEALLEEIDYHTLMIEMLAKTLAESMGSLTIGEVTEKLKTGHLDDPELQEIIETSHSKKETELFRHLFVTFQMADLSEEEKVVLKKFYFLLPQPYSLNLLIYFFNIKKEDEKSFRNILKKLNERGWLNRNENAFSMHRLIQQVVYYKLMPGIADAEGIIDVFTNLTYYDLHIDKTTCFPYIPYAQYTVNRIVRGDLINSSFSSLLNNLGALYSDIQQYEQAAAAYNEALYIRRKLAASNPAAFEPGMAMTLTNLGTLYNDIQQYKQAAAAYNEALDVFRRLATANPAAFEPNIAMTLTNLGILYRVTQQYEQATAAYNEALDVFRRLAAANPAAFESALALTLNNLGNLYSDIQQYEQAAAAYNEALYIRRKLAASNPAAFEPDVAMTLNNLGNLYTDIDQYKEAAVAYNEALDVYRRLAASNPAAFEPAVAMTLNNLGTLYTDIDQYKEAAVAYNEALDVYRRLAASNPAAFEPDVAMTLNNLGILYNHIDQYKEAVTAFKEALQIRMQYLTSQPFLWKKIVNHHLSLAGVYKNLQQQENAIEYIKWGLVILLLYCQKQEEANPFINFARRIIKLCEIDFEKFWNNEVIPEVQKLRNQNQ